MAIQRKRDENGDTVFWCWTADYVYKLSGGLLVSKEPHAMGFIPIFEYTTGNARLGAFEPAMGLIDALNIIENNRVDGVEQFVQFFMKCVNVKLDPEQYAELREAGLMSFTSDPGARGRYLSADFNQMRYARPERCEPDYRRYRTGGNSPRRLVGCRKLCALD